MSIIKDMVDKYIVLGVAFEWGILKGLDVFKSLSEKLDERYQIVMVGVDNTVAESLPDNIIAISKTNNQHELATIYSAADVFVNPTREDNYPTVNMESIACGTPVITFDTGGSPEMVEEGITGMTIRCNDMESLINCIKYICENHIFFSENCLLYSSKFDKNICFQQYLTLYEDSANE